MDTDEGEQKLKAFQLKGRARRRASQHHLFLSQKDDELATQQKIVKAFTGHLRERTNEDREALEKLTPFANLEESTDIKVVHRMLGHGIAL